MSRSLLPPLFYCRSIPKEGEAVEIVGDEAGHILRSRRLARGDSIGVTDGQGTLAMARITNTSPGRKKLWMEIQQFASIIPRTISITLASALPKRERQSTMLDMATQMGMNDFIPLRCEHSAATVNPKIKERWEKIIKQSGKQCRQVHFPKIRDELTLTEVLSSRTEASVLVYADYDGAAGSDLIRQIHHEIKQVIAIIGPEGGFSEKEMNLLREKGALALKLGHQILRTETAAVALLSAINQIISPRERKYAPTKPGMD